MKRRLLISGTALLLLTVGLGCGAIYYAAFTTAGLQLIAKHVPRRIGDAQLTIQTVRGTLARGFEVARVEIEHKRCHLILEGIKGRLSIAPLLWETIEARDLRLQRAFVEVRRSTEPTSKWTPRFLPIGLTVRAEGTRVESGSLIATNGRRFDTAHIEASGVVRHRTMRIYGASFDWEAVHVDGNAELRAADPIMVKGDARIGIAWPQQPAWIIDASANGDLKALPLHARITAPFRADFNGRALDLTGAWHWEGNGRIHDFDLRAWGGGNVLGRITGALALHGNAQGFSGHGPLTPAGLQAGAFETAFAGSYANRVVTANRIEVIHPSGASLRATGTIGIVSNGPRLDLRGDWRDFRWPLVGGNIAVRSASGTYNLSGVWPYEWQATGPLAVRDLAPMPVTARGRLAKDRAYLDEVMLKAFDGQANLQGEVTWTPAQRWTVGGLARGVNPGRLRASLPGKLDFAFDAQGEGFDGKGDYTIAIRNLAGQLRKTSASGGGRIARRGATWQLDDIHLALGRTQINAAGRIAREMDMRFSLDTQDLSLLSQESRGQLHAQAQLRGTLEDPVVRATLSGKGIRHENIALGQLDADIDFDARNAHASKVGVQARNLVYGKRSFDTVTFALEGPASAHSAQLNFNTGDLRVQLQAEGSFNHGSWSGQLRTFNVNSTDSLSLALDSPIALLVSTQHVRAERLCLHGKPAQICVDGDWTPAHWAALFTAKEAPLATLTSGLTDNVEYRGSLTVSARATGGKTEPVQGEVRADLVDARILHRLASGRQQSILLGSGLITANATATGIEGQAELGSGRVGSIKGHVSLARSTPNWQDMPLQGELQAETAELGFIALYAPQIDRTAGRLAADLKFSGTAGTPFIAGTIRLTDAELDQYQVNLALRGAMIEARLAGTGLDFNGSARVGAGEAHTNGHLEWRDAQPYGQFHLEGQNLRVTDVPEAQIDASPNLDFRVAGRRIEVSGAVLVPRAKIVPADLRNAVRSSADEVTVGVEAVEHSKPFEVVTDIKLTLGDRVNIDTSGLTGLLKGSIALHSEGEEATTGTGELSVAEGKYTAYARKLDIQRGRLIFTGGPIQNPGVDIRAVKQFPDVLAGVNVRGTLLSPRMTFFSDPTLPQSQILSLILAGGSLQSVQNRQTGNELLAQGGAILAQQLGSRVGIQDVSVESDLSNETSVVLGKYLSPRLYVSYGISLAESINTMKLQYTLGDHWTVRTESGKARSADLVYTIEK